jgi:hypothetical protein
MFILSRVSVSKSVVLLSGLDRVVCNGEYNEVLIINPSVTLDIINQIEESFPVDEWIINNIHVWPLFRIQLATEIEGSGEEINGCLQRSNVSRVISMLYGLKDYVIANMSDYASNANFEHTSKLVFLGHTTCRQVNMIEKKAYDTFFDPIADLLEEQKLNSLMLEFAPQNEYRIPRYRKSIFIQPSLDWIVLKSQFSAARIDVQLEGISDLAEYLSSNNIGRLDVKQIVRKVRAISALSEYFIKILLKSEAEVGMVVCYYGIYGMAFNLACRRLGIPSVDIQHGVAGELHRAYGRWEKVPAQGYELLPSIFWCWSESEELAINHWNSKCKKYHKAIVGGNLWMDMWLDSRNYIVQFYNDLVRDLVKLKHQKNILLTMQPGIKCSEFVLRAIADSPPEWSWWIRLHPAMLSEKKSIYELFYSNNIRNIEIENASRLPLMALLNHTDVHVTGWSTVVLEADFFGVPSIVTHQAGEQLYRRQIDCGTVISSFTTESLLSAIQEQLNKKYIGNIQKQINLNPNSNSKVLLSLLSQKSDEIAM